MQRTLTGLERDRFARHLSLPEIGESGQVRLLDSSALVVGVGGLGAPAALYLAAAGIGRIGLLDDDVVEQSNLQRQVLFHEADVGRRKVEVASERLEAASRFVRIERIDQRLDARNARSLVRSYDIVINGADNFPTRYAVSDACVLERKPHVHGAIYRFQGEVSLFAPGRGPCYRCLHPRPPLPGSTPSCRDAGVLGVLPGLVGSLQALEAIKWLLALGEPLAGRLLLFDALGLRWREVGIARDPGCPACGEAPTILEPQEENVMCPSDEAPLPEIGPAELESMLRRGDAFRLVDVREPGEWAIAALPTAERVPMGQVGQCLDRWDPHERIVVMCRSGKRSAQVQAYLRARGFVDVWNLRGGILAWADEIDPTMAKY